MRRRPLVPSLYRALFDISQMRDEVRVLREDVADDHASRLLSRLEVAEREVLRLIDSAETRSGVVAH